MGKRTVHLDSDDKEFTIVDPEGNFIFLLEIDGITVAQFMECSGLKTSTEVFELQEGGVNHRVHKLPGQSRWENIVLRHGVTNDLTLLEWRNEVLQDTFNKRRNGAIILMDLEMKTEVRRWNFINAWPVSYEGPSLNADQAELAIETFELAHDGLSVQAGG